MFTNRIIIVFGTSFMMFTYSTEVFFGGGGGCGGPLDLYTPTKLIIGYSKQLGIDRWSFIMFIVHC